MQASALPDRGSLPALYRRRVILRDGRQVLLRPVRRTERDAIRELFGRLSPDSRFLRFHYYKPGLSEQEADYFCDVDQKDHVALVAELPRHGRDEIVAVARYYRLERCDQAEVSFVVEDAEQGCGIGTALLEHLADIALRNGITTLVAELLHENAVMMDIFRRYDPDLEVVVDGNSCHVTFAP